MKMKKILREWRSFVNEDIDGSMLDPVEIEDARIGIAVAVERAILSPKLPEGFATDENGEMLAGMDTKPSDPAEWTHITKIKDIVNSGRQIPFLYYAYRGVSPEGKLQGLERPEAANSLTATKVYDFLQHFEGKEESKAVFISDFWKILDEYNTFKDNYNDELVAHGAREPDDQVGRTDAAFYALGASDHDQMGGMSFSVSALGAGSKPVSFVNQDFMYKDSPEMHNIPRKHHFLFSPYYPMAIALILLERGSKPSNPSEVMPMFKQAGGKYEDAVSRATALSKQYQLIAQIPAMNQREFKANYIMASSVAAFDEYVEDVMVYQKQQAEMGRTQDIGTLYQKSKLGEFLLKLQMIVTSDAPPRANQMALERLNSLMTPQVLEEISYVAEIYPQGGLPQIRHGSTPPPAPEGFPDSKGDTLAALVDRAELMEYLFNQMGEAEAEAIGSDEYETLSKAVSKLRLKGLLGPANSIRRAFNRTKLSGGKKIERLDHYEVVITPEDMKTIAQSSADAQPAQQKVSRALQQANRRAKNDFKTKMELAKALSQQDVPRPNEIKKLGNFLTRLEKKISDGKVSSFAIPAEEKDQYMQYLQIAKDKLGIKEDLREHFRRFL